MDFTNLKKFMDDMAAFRTVGNAAEVYLDGKKVFSYVSGYSDQESKTPLTGDEMYNIYSCSKVTTVTAGTQLLERGKILLNDPLYDYIPEFKEMYIKKEDGNLVKARNPITVGDLFTMTAGFTYNTNTENLLRAQEETKGRCTTRETMTYLAQDPLAFEPGAKWQYSLCHDVLAAVVEVISGVRFSEYLKKNIFDPLGMNRTTFLLPKEELLTIAPQYRAAGENKESVWCGPEIHRFKLGSEYESGGAGGISCVDDYVKFLEALRVGDVILGKDTIAMMATDRLTPEQKQTFSRKPYGYGLGVQCPSKEGAGRITRFGWGGAAGAVLGVDPKRNMVFYYVQHVFASRMDSMKEQVYRAIIDDMDQ